MQLQEHVSNPIPPHGIPGFQAPSFLIFKNFQFSSVSFNLYQHQKHKSWMSHAQLADIELIVKEECEN